MKFDPLQLLGCSAPPLDASPSSLVPNGRCRWYNRGMPALRLPLSVRQLSVLKWVAGGCAADQFEGHSHKVIARALANRRLVQVKRTAGIWGAALLPDGVFYLEHGRFPEQRADPVLLRPTVARASRPAKPPEANPPSPPVEGTVPVSHQIRSPHPAIRELLDHPKRIELPDEVRRRVHLISHSLVQEALRRQWRVTPVLSTVRDRWGSGRERTWDSNDLFRIDAGEQPVGVQFRLRSTRTDHVDTPDEARRRARNQYVFTPRYDYVPTTILRLFLYARTSQMTSWEDKKSAPIEDRLAAVLNRVEKASSDVLLRRQAERERQELEQARQQEASRQRARVAHYETWLQALQTLRSSLDEHTALTAVVARLRHDEAGAARGVTLTIAAFVAWADEHLAASDPMRTLDLPTGDAPDMSWNEYQDWKARLRDRTSGGTWFP